MSFDRRVTPARGDIAASHLRGSVAAERFVDGDRLQVGVPLASLHTAPDAGASLGSQLLYGEDFVVYDHAGGWAWGQASRDSYVGYVRGEALRRPGAPPTHRVSVLRGLVFPAPDLKRPIVGALALNARLAIGAAQGDYAEIEGLGWISTRHIAETDRVAGDWVAVAEQFIGAPYLWGGRTQEGLDCSGLVQTALEAAGKIVARDTDLLAQAFSDEAAMPLRRGDLVFWRGHVGIMADSKNLLHANAFHMAVTLEALDIVIARQSARNEPVTWMARPNPNR